MAPGHGPGRGGGSTSRRRSHRTQATTAQLLPRGLVLCARNATPRTPERPGARRSIEWARGSSGFDLSGSGGWGGGAHSRDVDEPSSSEGTGNCSGPTILAKSQALSLHSHVPAERRAQVAGVEVLRFLSDGGACVSLQRLKGPLLFCLKLQDLSFSLRDRVSLDVSAGNSPSIHHRVSSTPFPLRQPPSSLQCKWHFIYALVSTLKRKRNRCSKPTHTFDSINFLFPVCFYV